jgi:type IV pilus assembly protein PilV
MVRRGAQRGMTLIEVMVALLVASVGLLGSLAMVGAVWNGTTFSRHATEAQVLAQSRLEQLQSLVSTTSNPLPSDTAPVGAFADETGTGVVANPIDATGAAAPATGGTLFYRQVQWSTLNYATGLQRGINVKVCWNDLQPLTATCPNPVPAAGTGYHEVIVSGMRLP